MLLSLNNYSVTFGNGSAAFTAVNNIDLDIEPSVITGLIGESGSGKSVLSQSITQLIQAADITGSCLFDSTHYGPINLVEANEHELRSVRQEDISYIFQEPMTALNPLMKCADQIAESIADSSKVKDTIIDLLSKVELTDHLRIARSYPHELSGGQRQRVMIAMALAKNPKLLIADEPTTALDVAVQNEILALLKNLAKSESMAVLFITHDLLSLKGFADNIAVMYKGELVEYGEQKAILSQPQHPYTKALMQSRASYEKRGKELAELEELIKGSYKSHPIAPSNATDEVLISMKSVVKWHLSPSLFKKSKTEVLRGVDLDIYQGDSFGLIGESGSGKSTIAKLLLKIWRQNSGTIKIKGQDISGIKDFETRLQLVFQDPYSSLNPKHRVGKAIAEVLRSTGKKGKLDEVEALLSTVGLLPSDYTKYPHEFSGGQRQRICIAKALAKSPEILVLDEAVSALDVSVQAKILNLLNKLKQEKGLTYLLISHDMNVVSYFCNRIAVIKNGQIQEVGKTEDLIAAPTTEYTQSLLENSIY